MTTPAAGQGPDPARAIKALHRSSRLWAFGAVAVTALLVANLVGRIGGVLLIASDAIIVALCARMAWVARQKALKAEAELGKPQVRGPGKSGDPRKQ